MKRKSWTLTAVSFIVQSMRRSSHQAGVSGNGPRRPSRAKIDRPMDWVLDSTVGLISTLDMKSVS